jgi:hypothetical protein
MPEPLELALNPDHSPSWVVPRDPDDQPRELRIQRRSTRLPVLVCPLAPHELAVPAPDRRRSDDERRRTIAFDQSRQRRDHDPVASAQAGPGVPSLQNRELVPKDQDLGFAPTGVGIRSGAEQGSDDEVARGEEHRRMVEIHWSERRTRVCDPFRQERRLDPLLPAMRQEVERLRATSSDEGWLKEADALLADAERTVALFMSPPSLAATERSSRRRPLPG